MEEMWGNVEKPDALLPPPNIGRHGLSKNRFDTIKRKTAFYFPSRSELDERDPWRFCRPIEDDFNRHLPTVFSPGWIIELDESMFMWLGGEDSLGKPDKIPFLSVVERKPTPVGAEVTSGAELPMSSPKSSFALRLARARSATSITSTTRTTATQLPRACV